MRVFIDCEFNGFHGHLITMALVSEDGNELYVDVDPCDKPVCDFVRQYVIPVIEAPGAVPHSLGQDQLPYALSEFLCQYGVVHLIADWPDDIKYFCESLITAPGKRVDTPEMVMQIIREDAESEVPHNALYDARAIRDVYNEVYINNGDGEELNV